MTDAALIPDRRRNHFPLNGGPRPTEFERHAGSLGIEAARAVLEATIADPPSDPTVQRQLTPDQVRRARSGIARARAALLQDVRDTGEPDSEWSLDCDGFAPQ